MLVQQYVTFKFIELIKLLFKTKKNDLEQIKTFKVDKLHLLNDLKFLKSENIM